MRSSCKHIHYEIEDTAQEDTRNEPQNENPDEDFILTEYQAQDHRVIPAQVICLAANYSEVVLLIYTHTHTHARAHAHAHTRTHLTGPLYLFTASPLHAHMNTRAHAHTHTHTRERHASLT